MAGRKISATAFAGPAEFRRWLTANCETATELVLKLAKVGKGGTGLGYQDAVAEALCFGWIDGIGRRLDDAYHAVRFTPRKPDSIWSQVNLKKVEVLVAQKRMAPRGLRVFNGRNPDQVNKYSFENEARELTDEMVRRFKTQKKAWAFFSSQAPSYQRTAKYWVLSAKKPETQRKRLDELIRCSAKGGRPNPFKEWKGK